jgi:hypothetical protein
VSSFLGGNRAKTDTNGPSPPTTHNTCPRPHKTPKAHPANMATCTSRTHASSRRPMPNSRPNMKKTGSSDSEDERTSADESLHAETTHRLSSSPHAPEAAAPTSDEGKSTRRTSRTRQKRSRLTRSCRNHTIADHRHRCHASHPHETLHPPPNPTTTPVDGFRVARTRGTTRRTQRFERRGLNV